MTSETQSTVAANEAARATESDPRWAAVVARDSAFDNAFYDSVRTTGVYCRPSCAARLASPKNVAFHLSTTEAKAAGFRACKRCKPDDPPLVQQHAAMIAAACRTIEAAEYSPTFAELARNSGLSPHHFHRVFKAMTGVTPHDYAAAQRAKRVQACLAEATTVTDAIYDAGYGSGSRFYEKAGTILGMTPTRYRNGGSGAEIRFAVGESSLGPILVAQSAKGICAILIGDDPDTLVRDVQDRFPRAHLRTCAWGLRFRETHTLRCASSPTSAQA